LARRLLAVLVIFAKLYNISPPPKLLAFLFLNVFLWLF